MPARTPDEEVVYTGQTVAMTIDTILRAHPDDDQLEEALNLLVRHVEKREAAKVRAAVGTEAQPGPSPLRVRTEASRMVHEAVASRFGLLLPACGVQARRTERLPDGTPLTCPMCNGTEQPINQEPRCSPSLQPPRYLWRPDTSSAASVPGTASTPSSGAA